MKIKLPDLAPGEIYVGCLGNAEGNLRHVILLSGDIDLGTRDEASEWAESIGGRLPTRLEQVLLFDSCSNEFLDDWYWSSDEYTVLGGAFTWCQHFGSGMQRYFSKTELNPARAVRRFPVEIEQ